MAKGRNFRPFFMNGHKNTLYLQDIEQKVRQFSRSPSKWFQGEKGWTAKLFWANPAESAKSTLANPDCNSQGQVKGSGTPIAEMEERQSAVLDSLQSKAVWRRCLAAKPDTLVLGLGRESGATECQVQARELD